MSKALGISILNLIATQAHRSTLVRKGYLLPLRILPRLTQRTRSVLYWERRYVSGGTSGPGSYGSYVRRLFSASRKFVILYTSDTDENPKGQSPHIQHRNVTTWIARNIDGWQMIERIPNRFPYAGDSTVGSFADFLIYGRKVS
jgi:hypothetical protein